MNAVVEMKPAGALAIPQNSGRMAVADIISHVATVQEVMRAVMKKDVHFGIIPGTDKPTLLKPGAEVLCMAFRIADSYQVEDLSEANTVRYRVTCIGTHQTTGVVLGTGMGEASSAEEKYKWRKAFEPEFNATPENMRRKKQGYNKVKRENYEILQVRTEHADLANTILKMANKRAKMAMVLNVTAASDCFTQDLEDMDEAMRDHLARQESGAAATAGAASTSTGLPGYTPEQFALNIPIWTKVLKSGKKTVDEVLATIATVATLTEEQAAAVRAIPAELVKAAGQRQPDAATGPVVMTFAQVADKLNAAGSDPDKLAEAGSLIAAVPDEVQRKELGELYDRLAAAQ